MPRFEQMYGMQTAHSTSQCPDPLDDPNWLRSEYVDKRLGSHEIARKVGRAPSTVLYNLRKHGIPIRTSRVSRHAECDGSWLAEHYLDRDDYLTWCREHGLETAGDGGHGLPASACAAQAGVSRETIRRWLVQHGIERRGHDDRSSVRRERRHRYSLGRAARAAIQRFEAEDVVQGVSVHASEIIVEYITGLRERWALGEDGKHRLRFPDRGWWTRLQPRDDVYVGLYRDDGERDPYAEGGMPYSSAWMANMGFLDQRVLVHKLVRDLTSEGWRRPQFTAQVLEADLRAVLADTTRHAASPGYVNGQPGRPSSGVPAGIRLALDLVDWGPLRRPGGIALEDAWRDPRRVYWAIESLLRRGEDITREGIIHRVCVGAAEGVARRSGPLVRPVSYYVCLLRDVLSIDLPPIVFDPDPGCGTKAVAVAALGGVYLHPERFDVRRDSPLWAPVDGRPRTPEIEADDYGCAAVALVESEDLVAYEEAIDEYRGRCDQIVTRLPWCARAGALAFGARVVRLRARPYRREDEIIAVWSHR